MAKQILKAQSRKLVGRKVKTLRAKGILPASVFGKKIKSLSLSVEASEFKKVYKEVGETGILYLQVENEKEDRPVLVTNIQKEPVTDSYLHIDFHQVDLKEKVQAKVPVELSGESPAEKQGIGTVVQYIDEIEVEALPADLPDKFVLDVSSLSEVDQAIHIQDLKIDRKKVEIKIEGSTILVKVEPPQKEEVVAPTPAETQAVGPEGAVKAEGEGSAQSETPAQAPASQEKSPEA